MRATEQNFLVVLFIMLKEFLTVKEILKGSNQMEACEDLFTTEKTSHLPMA